MNPSTLFLSLGLGLITTAAWAALKPGDAAPVSRGLWPHEAVLDRLAWQIAKLRVSLDRCTLAHELMRAELTWG